MCSKAVVCYAIAKPNLLLSQIGKMRILQLCQQNRYSWGFVNLSIYFGKSAFNNGIKKTADLIEIQKNNYSSANLPGAISKHQAKELAVKLTSDEREILISALQECQSMKLKAEFEGQLAAFRWRNKFGRPSTIPSLGQVDPTGSYCAVPDDWLYRKYAETVTQPKSSELIRVLVANAIPFIGFGFLDNFIMIIAGDRIELYLGTVITLSTMAAAAIGNTFSDIMGIGSAYYVELIAQKIGFEQPKLTPIQLDLPKSRIAANLGRVIGVTIGCILGMTPLLFLHHDEKNSESEIKKNSEKDELPVLDKKTSDK